MYKKIGMLLVGLLAILLPAGCSNPQNFDSRLDAIVKPYKFDMARWELNSLTEVVKQAMSGIKWADTDTASVLNYFDGIDKEKKLAPLLASVVRGDVKGDHDALSAEKEQLDQESQTSVTAAEFVLRTQIRTVLSEQGIYNPYFRYTGLKIGFPPVNFKLEKPVHVLVISKRERIGTFKQVILDQDLSVTDMEQIEQEADKLGVSSLVVETGGYAGTYPTFVTNRADLRFTIEVAAHEWTHQYLAFRPLGFRYVLSLLGLRPDPEINAMNETVADMVGREIGNMAYARYYAQYDTKRSAPPVKSGFDYDEEMKSIRRQTDFYLAAGFTDQAEQFMEEKRQYLASKGHYIRKLNQAYFAFYGSYASSPGSISPLGGELKRLRSASRSVGDFLEKAASITNHTQLMDLIK